MQAWDMHRVTLDKHANSNAEGNISLYNQRVVHIKCAVSNVRSDFEPQPGD